MAALRGFFLVSWHMEMLPFLLPSSSLLSCQTSQSQNNTGRPQKTALQHQEGGRSEQALKCGADAVTTYDSSVRRMPGQGGIFKGCTIKNDFEVIGPRMQSGILPGLSGFQLGGGGKKTHKSQPWLTRGLLSEVMLLEGTKDPELLWTMELPGE